SAVAARSPGRPGADPSRGAGADDHDLPVRVVPAALQRQHDVHAVHRGAVVRRSRGSVASSTPPASACASANSPYSTEAPTADAAGTPNAASATTAAASRVPHPPKLTGSVAIRNTGTATAAQLHAGSSMPSARPPS